MPLGPVMTSIILFVRPDELKAELNKTFRERHPWVHAGLSLSKIRSLKQAALNICIRNRIDVATVALACVYFEKLVLKNLITKMNRKLMMACCLLLAFKFNEPLDSVEYKVLRKKLLEDIDRYVIAFPLLLLVPKAPTHADSPVRRSVFTIPANEVLTQEFSVWASLSFGLHVQLYELAPHFNRLLKMCDSNPEKYLCQTMYNHYMDTVYQEQRRIASRQSNLEGEGAEEDEEDDDDMEEEEEDEEVPVITEDSDFMSGFKWINFWKKD